MGEKYAYISGSYTNLYARSWTTDGKCADISIADTGHIAQLRLAYGFEIEKLLNPANPSGLGTV
jgi:hypothetical protein